MKQIFAIINFLFWVSLIYVISLAGVVGSAKASSAGDPWGKLQDAFKPEQAKQIPILTPSDPWEQLRAVFLPFSLKEDTAARYHPKVAKKVAWKINQQVLPYDTVVKKAAQIFDIPEVILQSLIMAESGGDPWAKAKTTSAKGLMQTIDSTFKMARAGLAEKGIHISDDPYNPSASVLAGAWYLDQMYKKAVRDKKIIGLNRSDISSWRYPLEYYYAGPGNGVRPENKIMVYSNGSRRIIDKRAYSKKIQTWAALLEVS